jgi:hypothetical protein
LPHDLMSGGKRDQRFEAETGRHRAAVRDPSADRFGKGYEF